MTARTVGSRGARVLAFVAFVVLVFAVAGVGGSVTAPAIGGWYAGLAKPGFNPPNGVFGPVWTLLYAFMAVAAWRVWRARGLHGAPLAMGLFFLQLALNLAWSLIFFGAHRIGWALADIAALWLAVAATMVLFWRHDRVSGLLFAPYLAWVSFAAALNVAIWRLNPA
jgi:tryptophan-rich sensory protein